VHTASIRLLAVVASAFLFALYARVALPWAWLGWIALVPWLASLDRESRLRGVAISGVLMSMAFTAGVFGWFADAFARYAQAPRWAAYGLLLLAAPLLQLQFLVFALARWFLRRRAASGFAVAVGAAAAWIGSEWAFPRLFGDTLGHGLLPFATLRQGADVAGAPGLTLLIVVVNQWIHAGLRHWRRSFRAAVLEMAGAGLLIAALAGYGAIRLRQLEHGRESAAPFRAALVQASLGDYGDLRARLGTFGAVQEVLDTHRALSRRAIAGAGGSGGLDLLVWPETVYPTTFGRPKSEAGAELDDELVRFVEDSGVPLLFGTYDRDGRGEYNAAVLLSPRGGGAERYRKRRPFPLTEYVPAWLDGRTVRLYLPWLGTWLSGDGPPVLALRRSGADLAIAPMICLDAVDPSLAIDAARRGAELIVTLSNDGWFAAGGGAQLHLTVSAFRSIETRLPQLRATNTGISAAIDRSGEILVRADSGEDTALLATVRPGRALPTLMLRWGDWLGPGACILAFLLGLRAAVRRPGFERRPAK
jgi:apolipoprotein N-acyltransferase